VRDSGAARKRSGESKCYRTLTTPPRDASRDALVRPCRPTGRPSSRRSTRNPSTPGGPSTPRRCPLALIRRPGARADVVPRVLADTGAQPHPHRPPDEVVERGNVGRLGQHQPEGYAASMFLHLLGQRGPRLFDKPQIHTTR